MSGSDANLLNKGTTDRDSRERQTTTSGGPDSRPQSASRTRDPITPRAAIQRVTLTNRHILSTLHLSKPLYCNTPDIN